MSQLIHIHCQLLVKESTKVMKFPLLNEIMERGCQIICLPSLLLLIDVLQQT